MVGYTIIRESGTLNKIFKKEIEKYRNQETYPAN